MKNKKVFAFLLLLLCPSFVSYAYWVWSPETGKFVNPEGAVQDTAEEQYEYAMRFYREKDLDEAIDQLKHLLKKYRGSRIAPEAQYRLGTIFEEKGDYWKSFQAYKVLIESYPQSDRINEVVEREFRIGNLFLSGRKAKFMGLEILPSLPRAVEIFAHIVKEAPYSSYGDKAQFRLGLTYKQWGRFSDALDSFQAVIDNYPQSDLVAEARFQLAETSFLKSNYAMRDQRALESASAYVDRFLTRYSDTTAAEKAAKLRQEIDEKNAEKNYRIASYYEKTDYLSSALIYYSDVAARYPHTKWGRKSIEKLKSLEEPVAYLNDQREQVRQAVQSVQVSLEKLPEQDKLERGRLERKLARLKQREKILEKSKSESMKSRSEDLKRRESELKEKYKKLERKKKMLKTNKSDDFKRALERWEASLNQEREGLARERAQLKDWKESLGMASGKSVLGLIPFMGEPESELEKVRQVDAKQLFKVARQKKDLLEEKEVLYKQYSEIAEQLKNIRTDQEMLALEAEDFSGEEEGSKGLRMRRERLRQRKDEIVRLEGEIKTKRGEYEERFEEGKLASLMRLPGKVVAGSTRVVAGTLGKSISMLNPFSGKGDLSDKDTQELAELRMHYQEKIATQQNVIDTLNEAFDQELAHQEQERLLKTLGDGKALDPRKLRKTIKRLEKTIRKNYEEIDDRDKRKKKLVEELAVLLHEHDKSRAGLGGVGYAVASPFKLIARGTKSFIFGRTPKDAEVTQAARKLPLDDVSSKRAKEIKDEIEMESLMIDAKSWEIRQLEKELEMAKAKASLQGGLKFRSSIVRVPYEFIGDAIEGAKRIIPKQSRQEILVSRLEKATREMAAYQEELRRVDKALEARSGNSHAPAPAAAVQEGESALMKEVDTSLDEAEKALRDADTVLKQETDMAQEIESLNAELIRSREDYATERSQLVEDARALKRPSPDAEGLEEREKKFRDAQESLSEELEDIEKELRKLIAEENELEQKETRILEKRIDRIDQVIQRITSEAEAQNLLQERARMEGRLNRIDARRNFLSKELERFQLPNTESASL